MKDAKYLAALTLLTVCGLLLACSVAFAIGLLLGPTAGAAALLPAAVASGIASAELLKRCDFDE